MIEFDCEEVKRQLNRMAEELPQDMVDIWVKWDGHRVEYTAYVNNRGDFASACGTGADLIAAVDEALRDAGPRGGQAAITAKRKAIEKARSELAALEASLDPLVMAIDATKEIQDLT
jgi:hypothetical protein